LKNYLLKNVTFFSLSKKLKLKMHSIRALLAASAAKFNIAPIRWQHPSHVAIVRPESKGKREGNDWDTACRNFKTSISSIHYNKKCVCSFSLPK
jgi:hypothetical protein